MIRRITRLAVATAAAGAFWASAVAPASAHTPNSYANWACGGSRLNTYDIVTHAVPTDLTPYTVTAYCRSGTHDTQWYATLWSTGAITHSDWNFCYLGEYCSPEP